MKTVAKLGIVAVSIIAASAISATAPARAADGSNAVKEPSKAEAIYQGTWVTTKNKKLNGTANCQIKLLAKDKWQGRFWGLWEHVPFDYTVEFGVDHSATKTRTLAAGQSSSKVRLIPVVGKAVIDGANYDWTGQLSAEEFKIQFTGDRYEGSMDMKRTSDKTASR
jgi:hypothetical protein